MNADQLDHRQACLKQACALLLQGGQYTRAQLYPGVPYREMWHGRQLKLLDERGLVVCTARHGKAGNLYEALDVDLLRELYGAPLLLQAATLGLHVAEELPPAEEEAVRGLEPLTQEPNPLDPLVGHMGGILQVLEVMSARLAALEARGTSPAEAAGGALTTAMAPYLATQAAAAAQVDRIARHVDTLRDQVATAHTTAADRAKKDSTERAARHKELATHLQDLLLVQDDLARAMAMLMRRAGFIERDVRPSDTRRTPSLGLIAATVPADPPPAGAK